MERLIKYYSPSLIESNSVNALLQKIREAKNRDTLDLLVLGLYRDDRTDPERVALVGAIQEKELEIYKEILKPLPTIFLQQLEEYTQDNCTQCKKDFELGALVKSASCQKHTVCYRHEGETCEECQLLEAQAHPAFSSEEAPSPENSKDDMSLGTPAKMITQDDMPPTTQTQPTEETEANTPSTTQTPLLNKMQSNTPQIAQSTPLLPEIIRPTFTDLSQISDEDIDFNSVSIEDKKTKTIAYYIASIGGKNVEVEKDQWMDRLAQHETLMGDKGASLNHASATDDDEDDSSNAGQDEDDDSVTKEQKLNMKNSSVGAGS
jgi:hypothetical protein